MKLFSIFKTPRHKQFSFEPRYYDPIKEDIEQRKAKIKATSEAEYAKNISFNFKENKRKTATASSTRTLLIVLLGGAFWGYLQYGKIALYVILFLAAGVYLLKRFRHKS